MYLTCHLYHIAESTTSFALAVLRTSPISQPFPRDQFPERPCKSGKRQPPSGLRPETRNTKLRTKRRARHVVKRS